MELSASLPRNTPSFSLANMSVKNFVCRDKWSCRKEKECIMAFQELWWNLSHHRENPISMKLYGSLFLFFSSILMQTTQTGVILVLITVKYWPQHAESRNRVCRKGYNVLYVKESRTQSSFCHRRWVSGWKGNWGLCFRVLHLELSHSNDKIHAKYSEIFSIETENRHIIENTLGKDIFCRDIPELSTCSKKIEAEVRPWRLELAGF